MIQVLLVICAINVIATVFLIAQVMMLKREQDYTEHLEHESSIDEDYIDYLQKQLDKRGVDYNSRGNFVRSSSSF
jgi:Na+-transporting NADH:ubiquinone oxidoreductase subunit NqrC